MLNAENLTSRSIPAYMKYPSFLRPSRQSIYPRPVVALGSSATEVFDYIFGDNSDYHPFWASGWSARGLRSQATKRYVETILSPIPRNAHIILSFGTADVLFNARFMAANKGVYDFRSVVNEAVEGHLAARKVISKLGFRNITAAFVSPTVSLPEKYWLKRGNGRQLSDRALGNMYFDIFNGTAKKMPTMDIFEETTSGPSGFYLLDEAFTRDYPEHHQDYIKTQDIVWEKLTRLDGMLPRRNPPHQKLYPHKPANLKPLIEAGTTRKRTCF